MTTHIHLRAYKLQEVTRRIHTLRDQLRDETDDTNDAASRLRHEGLGCTWRSGCFKVDVWCGGEFAEVDECTVYQVAVGAVLPAQSGWPGRTSQGSPSLVMCAYWALDMRRAEFYPREGAKPLEAADVTRAHPCAAGMRWAAALLVSLCRDVEEARKMMDEGWLREGELELVKMAAAVASPGAPFLAQPL